MTDSLNATVKIRCTNGSAQSAHKWIESKHGSSPVSITVINDSTLHMEGPIKAVADKVRELAEDPDFLRERKAVVQQIHPGQAIQLEETSMTDMSSQLLFDVRRLAEMIPPGVITVKGLDPADYAAQFGGPTGVVQATYDDIKSVGKLTVGQASALRGVGLYAVGGYFLGGKTKKAPAPRALSKIHDHVETVESDILELLALAGANPHTDRRRLDSARTQFELAFMMLKKAVDPEQERQ